MSANQVQTQAQARAGRSGDAYRAYAATKPTNLTPARTHVNSSTDGLYTGNSMHLPRGNANDHQQHASRDSGAQIVRV